MRRILLLLLAFALFGCAGTARSGEPEPIADPWSASCPSGTLAVYSAHNATCEAPHPCISNADCGYLEIDKLPPRVGYCDSGMCKAACGSGISRPCIN